MKLFTNTTSLLVKAFIAGAFLAQAHGAAYIKFDGIDGEAVDKDHLGWSEVLSFNQSIQRPGGRILTTLGDIVVIKTLDKATPKLAEAICKGSVIPKVTIEFTHETPEGRQTYLMWELTNAIVTSYSYSSGGTGSSHDGNPIPTESISLNFEEIKWTYNAGEDGDKGGNVEFEWKVEEGESIAEEDNGQGTVAGRPEQPVIVARQ